jgi:hypothetical protein
MIKIYQRQDSKNVDILEEECVSAIKHIITNQ